MNNLDQLERYAIIRARIQRLRKAMNRYTFRTEDVIQRHYIASRIAERIMELQLLLPSPRPHMPTVLTLAGVAFVPVQAFPDGSVRYKRGATPITLIKQITRPDIIQPFRHLFE